MPSGKEPPLSSCSSSHAGLRWWVLRRGYHLPRLPVPSSDSSWYSCHGSGHQAGRKGRHDGGRAGTGSKNRQFMEWLNYILFSRERRCWSSVCLLACLSARSFSWVHHPGLQGSRNSGSFEEPACRHESNGRRHLTGWTAVPLAPLDCGQQVTGHSWPLIAVILCCFPQLFQEGPAVGSGLQWERKDSFGGHEIERALALELGFKFSSAFAGWLGQILPFSGPQSLFYTLRRSEGWSLRHLSTEKGCNSHPVKEGRGGRYSVARWQALWWFTYPEAVLGTSCHRWAGRCSIIPAIWMERCGDSHILAMIATRGIVMPGNELPTAADMAYP